MYILGITAPISWNNAAALIKDGQLLSAAEEERFTRVKHSPRLPAVNAIKYCLNQAKISFNDVDYIAVGFMRPIPCLFKKVADDLNEGTLQFLHENLGATTEYMIQLRRLRNEMKMVYGDISKPKWIYIPHHISHAASTFRMSGFDEANVITLDGNGENDSGLLGVGRGNTFTKLEKIRLRDSLGEFYGAVTDLLGFKKHSHEGKTMGLAPFGKNEIDLNSQVVSIDDSGYRFNRNFKKVLWDKFGPRRDWRAPFTETHKNLAAYAQTVTEKIGVNVAERLYKKTGIRNVCMAGGVALNCDMNSRILQSEFVDNIYVQPASHDAGTAIGAAFEAYAQLGHTSKFKMDHASWGPEYSNEEIEALLRESKIDYQHHENIEEVTAKMLAEKKIIGWFQGRMEIGPRALGNRSILAHPGPKEMHEKVNREVKHRETWRPFAPSFLAEEAANYLEDAYPSPFMLLFFKVKKEMREKLAAVTHVDHTTRAQTVTPEANPRYYKMIQEFHNLTGLPAVMNTSFNDQGEPIVMSPRDALRTFYVTGLDNLVMGNFVLTKKKP